MPRAFCLIRTEPVYRREAFITGLQAAGYVTCSDPTRGEAGDVLVIWNRYGGNFQTTSGTYTINTLNGSEALAAHHRHRLGLHVALPHGGAVGSSGQAIGR